MGFIKRAESGVNRTLRFCSRTLHPLENCELVVQPATGSWRGSAQVIPQGQPTLNLNKRPLECGDSSPLSFSGNLPMGTTFVCPGKNKGVSGLARQVDGFGAS